MLKDGDDSDDDGDGDGGDDGGDDDGDDGDDDGGDDGDDDCGDDDADELRGTGSDWEQTRWLPPQLCFQICLWRGTQGAQFVLEIFAD